MATVAQGNGQNGKGQGNLLQFQPRPKGLGDLQSGAAGAAVTQLQTLLGKAGFPVALDGQFGPETLNAVKTFQASRGLTVDGIVGQETWDALTGGVGGPAPSPTYVETLLPKPSASGASAPMTAVSLLDKFGQMPVWQRALLIGGGLALVGLAYHLLFQKPQGRTAGFYAEKLKQKSCPRCKTPPDEQKLLSEGTELVA